MEQSVPDQTATAKIGVMPLLIASLLISSVALAWASSSGWLESQDDGAAQSNQVNNVVKASRTLQFVDHTDGSVEVIDHRTLEAVKLYQTGEGSFIRGVLRTLTAERRRGEFDNTAPFELEWDSANHLRLTDQATGTSLLLNSYGTSNVHAFLQLLPAEAGRG